MPLTLPSNTLIGSAMHFSTTDEQGDSVPESYVITNIASSGDFSMFEALINVGGTEPRTVVNISLSLTSYIILWLPGTGALDELFVSYGSSDNPTNSIRAFPIDTIIPQSWKDDYETWVTNGVVPAFDTTFTKTVSFEVIGSITQDVQNKLISKVDFTKTVLAGLGDIPFVTGTIVGGTGGTDPDPFSDPTSFSDPSTFFDPNASPAIPI